MKILQLITSKQLRGAEIVAAQLSAELTVRGHDVTLAALYQTDSAADELPAASTVRRAELQGRRIGRIECRPFAGLLRLMNDTRPDVIQANGFHALKYAALARRLAPGRSALVYRNISIAGRWVTSPIQRWWGRWLLSTVDRVLSVSDSSARDFVETYQFPEDKLFTVKRGIDIPSQLHRQRHRADLCGLIGCPPEAPLLLHVGSFTEEKNHSGLLAAFARIQNRFAAAQLVLVGDGPLREELQRRVDHGPLKGCVHFLGYRSDARDLLAGGDLLLLTSRVEGIPGVVLEAAARRVPSVATDVGGVSEAIDDRRSGRLAAAGDMDGLADAACDLLRDEALRLRMGNAAYNDVVTEHAMSQMVDRFEQHYHELTVEHLRERAMCSYTG